jgi:hypothetical protein
MRKVERHIDKDLLLELELEEVRPAGLQAGGHVLLLLAHPLLQQVLRRRAHLCGNSLKGGSHEMHISSVSGSVTFW